MNIKNNDLIIIIIVLVIIYLVYSLYVYNEDFVNVNTVSSLIPQLQNNVNNLISVVGNTNNALLNKINNLTAPSSETKNVYSLEKNNLNTIPSPINNNIPSPVNNNIPSPVNNTIPFIINNNIPSTVNNTIPINTNINFNLNDLFQRNRPSALYIADRIKNNILPNLIFPSQLNGVINKPSTKVNNRSNTTLPFFNGDISTNIIWPNILKPTHTLISITKYNGNNKRRILSSDTRDVFYGHFNGSAGVTHINPLNKINNNNDWVVTCVRLTSSPLLFNTNRIYDVIINNRPSGDKMLKLNLPNNNFSLTINKNLRNETSDFSFSTVCVIDSFLSDNDMVSLSNIFNTTLQNPMLFNSIESVINNISIPKITTNNNVNMITATKEAEIAAAKLRDAQIAAVKSRESEIAAAKEAEIAAAKLRDAQIAAVKSRESEIAAAKLRDAQIAAVKSREAEIAAAKLRDAQIAATKARDAQIAATKARDAQIAAVKSREAEIAAAKLRDAQIAATKARDAQIAATQNAQIAAAKLRDAQITATQNAQIATANNAFLKESSNNAIIRASLNAASNNPVIKNSINNVNL